MIFKFFKKQNGDIIEFYIDEDKNTITKYKNDVAIKNEVEYSISYRSKLIELCDDEEERKKICSL